MDQHFDPIIVAFCCWHCSYAAADLAGTSRIQYPTNIRIIRVPCTGRVDLIHIFKAFAEGADGVLVAGCLKGQCHYVDGNLKAELRVIFAKRILESIGIEPERLEMVFVSAAMGAEFASIIREFVERIRSLGPNPAKLKKHGQLKESTKSRE
ncbi:MAG: hydrogenase iron-sulfur subunit [Candidatus Baldrarchaeia archaeon]